MIQLPNFGCLLFLLLVLLVGGTPLVVGLARVGLFLFAAALIAAGIGSWWFRRHAMKVYIRSRPEHHNRYVETLVHLLVRLAQVDGDLDRREVTAIREFFQKDLGYRGEQLLRVRDLIQDARRSTASVADLCSLLVSEYDLQARLIVVEVLARVAVADGRIEAAEAAFLDEVARRLGLGPFVRGFSWQGGEFGGSAGGPGGGRRPVGPSSADQVADALAALGLAPGASAEEIKQAWRDLSKEHHPDRVTHLGEEFRRVAEQRMRRINAAYDVLKAAGLAS